jgi:hypothetical protein
MSNKTMAQHLIARNKKAAVLGANKKGPHRCKP